MKFVTLDAETTVRNKGEGAVGSFAASPFCKANKAVCWGAALGYEGAPVVSTFPTPLFWQPEHPILLVGHNIGFDLLHLFKEIGESAMLRALPNIHIWDTQHAEYLLSGQTHMYPSLNECAEARGLPLKDDKIAAYWADGVETEHIPYHELEEYNAYDVELTRAIFLDQWATMEDNPELLNLMRAKMEDKLSTIWMEWNGMAFDLVAADAIKTVLEKDVVSLERDVQFLMPPSWPAEVDFDIAKNEHVSAVLFGGLVKWDGIETLPETYKTGPRAGQCKTRKVIMACEVGSLSDNTAHKVATKKTGVFKLDDEVLSNIIDDSRAGRDSRRFCELVLQWREKRKDISTYYEGYSRLVWPDGLIHPSINHEATRTGRQSCTNPNLQNVTKKEEE